MSLQVNCETQDEVDHYWDRLSAGGDDNAKQCGWLKDRYGLSWQVVPSMLVAMLTDPDTVRAQRAFTAMLQMQKLDIAALKKAYDG
ncbi:3-demethylubiquinone-9 3-methyltransferase [compost metagenome]